MQWTMTAALADERRAALQIDGERVRAGRLARWRRRGRGRDLAGRDVAGQAHRTGRTEQTERTGRATGPVRPAGRTGWTEPTEPTGRTGRRSSLAGVTAGHSPE
jgi:hypothetical protein